MISSTKAIEIDLATAKLAATSSIAVDNQKSAKEESPTVYWLHLLLRLSDVTIDTRQEVRDSKPSGLYSFLIP